MSAWERRVDELLARARRKRFDVSSDEDERASKEAVQQLREELGTGEVSRAAYGAALDKIAKKLGRGREEGSVIRGWTVSLSLFKTIRGWTWLFAASPSPVVPTKQEHLEAIKERVGVPTDAEVLKMPISTQWIWRAVDQENP